MTAISKSVACEVEAHETCLNKSYDPLNEIMTPCTCDCHQMTKSRLTKLFDFAEWVRKMRSINFETKLLIDKGFQDLRFKEFERWFLG